MSITLPAAFAGPHRVYRDFALWLRRQMPKGLYARALLIVILPMVLLQSAVVFFFMRDGENRNFEDESTSYPDYIRATDFPRFG